MLSTNTQLHTTACTHNYTQLHTIITHTQLNTFYLGGELLGLGVDLGGQLPGGRQHEPDRPISCVDGSI